MRLMPIVTVVTLLSIWGGSVEAGPTLSPAEVAYVSEVRGRVKLQLSSFMESVV
jgi:hypothetical protein